VLALAEFTHASIPHDLPAEEDDDDTATYRGARAAPPRDCAIVDPCTGERNWSVVIWLFLTPSVSLSSLFLLVFNNA